MDPPSLQHEGSGLPHLPDRPSSAQFHPPPEAHRLSATIIPALSPATSSSSPTLFSAQQGVIHPILTAQGLSASLAHAHSPPLQDCEEPHVCLWDNCNLEFPSLTGLVSHLDRDHTLSMDKYLCHWKDCQRGLKPFDARYKLITHLRCHTGEKPYKCEVSHCARSFSRLENLKLHVRTHTGEKPYICHYDGCNKRFNNTSDRAKHMKTHVTRKPYACRYPGCGKSYTDPSSMRKHVKFAHKLKEKDSLGDGGTGFSGGGVTSIVLPRQSPRKQSSSSSSSCPSTPQTPTTGITMIVPRPSLTSPTPLTIGNTTILPTSPPRVHQSAVYIQSPRTTSGSNSNNNHPGGVVTVAPPTSSLVTVPVSAVVQPQMMAVQSARGQSLFIQSNNPQQPLLMVLPASTATAPNGNMANGVLGDHQLQNLVSSKVNTLASQSQQGHAAATVCLPTSGEPARYRASEGDGQVIQVVRNSQATSDEGEEEGSEVEQELRRKIAHLQQQLQMYQSKREKTQLTSEGHLTGDEVNHGSSGNSNATSAHSVTVSPPLQYQVTTSTNQLMGGASPNTPTHPPPQLHGQILALPAKPQSSQLPLAIGTTRNVIPYLHPAPGTRISVLHPSSPGHTIGHLPHSPARPIVNTSQQVLGMASGDQTVLPQIMLSASPVGAQLLPINVMQSAGVVAPQILQLAPALHADRGNT